MFRRLEALLQPEAETAALDGADTTNAEEARRAGYLAEFAALLLNAPRRADLLACAARIRASLIAEHGPAAGWPPIAAVPGGLVREGAGVDGLAMRWRISPGIDRSRFLAERDVLDRSRRGG